MFTIALTPPFRRARAYAAPLGTLLRRQTTVEPSSNFGPGSATLALRGWRPREAEPRRRLRERLGNWAVATFELLRIWHTRARSRRLLQELAERALRDIGLDRATAEYETNLPFWRAR